MSEMSSNRHHMGCNMKHMLQFIEMHPDSKRFSFAQDKATIEATKRLEKRGLIKVDWVTKQVVLNHE